MNKYISFIAIAIIAVLSIGKAFSQVITDKSFYWNFLPVESNDFHNYRGDHILPSMLLYETYLANTYTAPLIDIFERKGEVKSIDVKINKFTYKFGELVMSPEPVYENSIQYDSFGNIVKYKNSWGISYNGIKIASEQNRKVKKETDSRGLVIRVISNDNEYIDYEYDAKNRVVRVKSHSADGSIYDVYLIFQYSYLPNSEKISAIKVYNGKTGKSIGEAEYGYLNGKITNIRCANLGQETIEKHFSYDAKGNIKSFNLVEKPIVGGTKTTRYECLNTYNTNGSLAKCDYAITYFNNQEHETVSRKFKYDNSGNWIELLDGKVIIKREIKY